MINGAKVLRNVQVGDRFASHDFLSALRSDQTRGLLDAVIGSIEPGRDYAINLHQDEQVDDSHVMITGTVSFEPIVRCRDCKEYRESDCTCHSWQWHYWECALEVDPNGFCAWGERRDK